MEKEKERKYSILDWETLLQLPQNEIETILYSNNQTDKEQHILTTHEINNLLSIKSINKEYTEIRGDREEEKEFFEKVLDSRLFYDFSRSTRKYRNRLPNDMFADITPSDESNKQGMEETSSRIRKTTRINMLSTSDITGKGFISSNQSNSTTTDELENDSVDPDKLITVEKTKPNLSNNKFSYTFLQHQQLPEYQLRELNEYYKSVEKILNDQLQQPDGTLDEKQWDCILSWCRKWSETDHNTLIDDSVSHLTKDKEDMCFKLYNTVEKLVMVYWRSDEKKRSQYIPSLQKLQLLIDQHMEKYKDKLDIYSILNQMNIILKKLPI